jgi:hypothetical protein
LFAAIVGSKRQRRQQGHVVQVDRLGQLLGKGRHETRLYGTIHWRDAYISFLLVCIGTLLLEIIISF